MNFSNGISIGHGLLVAQLLSMLGGLFLFLLGALILYSIGQWRMRAVQVQGVIIGVRRRDSYFHSVYQYASSDGTLHEATEAQGTGSLKGRETGRHLDIQVRPDKPAEAREPHAPATWALAIGFLLAGAWLTYYSVTVWHHGVITWILLAALAAYVLRRLWRKLAPYLANARTPAAATTGWSAVPIENAETLRLATQQQTLQQGLQMSRSKSRRSDVLFCIVGLAIIATAWIPAQKLLQLRNGVKTEGTVMQLEPNTSDNNDASLYPVVQFKAADGSFIRFHEHDGVNPSKLKVGDHVPVVYQPGKLSTAMIDRGTGNWEAVWALLLLGTLFTALGALGLRAR